MNTLCLRLGALLLPCLATAQSVPQTAEQKRPGPDRIAQQDQERREKSIDRLRQRGQLQQAVNEAMEAAFDADTAGRPAETIQAALRAADLIREWRSGNMRAWDWMLLSHMTGIAAKNQLSAGRPTAADLLQREAWRHAIRAVEVESGTAWQPGQRLPQHLHPAVSANVVRLVRYDLVLLSAQGRNIEGLAQARKFEEGLTVSSEAGIEFRNQLLSEIAIELKHLGYEQQAIALMDRILAEVPLDASARFNKAWWTSQLEGPRPEYLAEARSAQASVGQGHRMAARSGRRLLARMAFAYREAGFDIGDLEAVVREAQSAGDELEAIYAIRETGRILGETGDFAAGEKNLLEALAGLRKIGRKGGEPATYRSYGELLLEHGRPAEAIPMLREAIRLTESFGWVQHLPRHLRVLAAACAATGDTAALRSIVARLEGLLASGKLEPIRRLDAAVAIAECRQALGDSSGARDALARGISEAKTAGVSEWMRRTAEKLDLSTVKLAARPAQPASGSASAAAQATADLQPVLITSEVLPSETARVRFTLSNPSAQAVKGKILVSGAPLEALWDDAAATGKIRMLPEGGAAEAARDVTLEAGGEFLLIGDAAGPQASSIRVQWLPESGAPQTATWNIARTGPDGVEVAVTNASLAGRNPFYALRLHHALIRRAGQGLDRTDFRVLASQPMRVELLDAATGALLAVDANGDGAFDGEGDILAADSDLDKFPDLPVAPGAPAEIALLVYPVTTAEPDPAGITLDLQLADASGWQTAARNILK